MTSSATAIWIICVVVVAGLAIWLGGGVLAARKPHQEHARGGGSAGRRSRAECTSVPAAASRRAGDTR